MLEGVRLSRAHKTTRILAQGSKGLSAEQISRAVIVSEDYVSINPDIQNSKGNLILQSFNSTVILVADLVPPYNYPSCLHIAITLAACLLTIISQLRMFKWTKTTHRSTTSVYEPKTPKISSISLPDERNSPMTYQTLYTERPSTRNSFLKRFSNSDSRPTTPLKESRNSIIVGVAPQSRLFSRTRTVSASMREVEGSQLSSLPTENLSDSYF